MRSISLRGGARRRVLLHALSLVAFGGSAELLLEGTARADNYREVELRFKHSGKYVDVADVSAGTGAKMHQWARTGADNQKFMLVPATDGYYYLRAKNSGLYLDVSNVGMNDGAQLHQWSYTGAGNQQFKFVPTPDGYFKLVARHSGKCVDVGGAQATDGAPVHQWSCGDTDSQKLTLIHDPRFDRELSFAYKTSGKCLDVQGMSTEAGASLQQWTCSSGANQRFRPVLTPEWRFNLVATHSGMCVEVSADGKLRQQPCDGGSAQKFQLTNMDPKQDYYFNLLGKDSKCLGVAGDSLDAGALVEATGCGYERAKLEPLVYENGSRLPFLAQIAKQYAPHLMIDSAQACNPLTFKESGSLDGFEDRCRSSFSDDFAMFAYVYDELTFPGGGTGWKANSFRVSYGVAFGWQSGEGNYSWAGSHGYDAQYLVVDVVDGQVSSVWADLHKGYYARTRGMLTMHDGSHVVAWVGRKYNSLKLVDDTTSMCSSDISYNPALGLTCYSLYPGHCACPLDSVLNWGDPVDNDFQSYGKLVMVEHACAADPSQGYTSADGVTYTADELAKLRGYMGCDGAAYQWGEDDEDGFGKNTFRYKDPYTKPYSLQGCAGGAVSDGGDICNASVFGSGAGWRTLALYRDAYIEPAVAGAADVDYTAGSPFNDLDAITAVPASITIRTGSRVDRVSVGYVGGGTLAHGGSGGRDHTISGLENDPVVAVELCSGSVDGKRRAGRVRLTTRDGRTLSGGDGSSDCQTIAPPAKRFLGFYGRSGGELDVLGTIWGNMSVD